MDRYVGLDGHAESCTFGVVGPSGKRLKSMVVETNGQILVDTVRSIPGRVHLCLEEGELSAWLHELLMPHVEELVVAVPRSSKGKPKDDLRDAFARAEELRIGAIATRVYKAQGGRPRRPRHATHPAPRLCDAPPPGRRRRPPRTEAPRPRQRPNDGRLHACLARRARQGRVKGPPSREAVEASDKAGDAQARS
jgi:hypothetical protein